ncbi:MAG: hypothetical protein ACRC7V_10050 [Lachnospiraceae bacterium]
MWDSTIDLTVKSRKDLIRLIKIINTDIEFKNITRNPEDREETIDLDKILKRYDDFNSKKKLVKFREEYDCKHCILFKKPRQCNANGSCPLEENPREARKSKLQKVHAKKPRCKKDLMGYLSNVNQNADMHTYYH